VIYQTLLEARRRLTPAERRAFARQIHDLIAGTARLERDKVDAAIDLLRQATADVERRLVRLPTGSFSRQQAAAIKNLLARELRDFEGAAQRLLKDSQSEFAELGSTFIDKTVATQGYPPPKLRISRELLLNATDRSADLITSLSARQLGRANDIINRGVISGRSVSEVARDLAEEFDKGYSRMETIARTEMLGIMGQAQMAGLNDMATRTRGLKKQWVAVLDSRTRPTHEEAHLQTVPVDEPFQVGDAELMFPRDPGADSPAETINCLLPGSMVEGLIVGATRAVYYGPAIEVITASGRHLAVTAQHPILTASGFVAARNLSKGDNLLCHGSTVENASSSNDMYERPATIEDIFSALSPFGAHRQAAGVGDFYGDGEFLNGDVDIVGPMGELLSDAYANGSKSTSQIVLEVAAVGDTKKSSSGSGHLAFNRVSVSRPGLPRLSRLADDGRTTASFDGLPFQPLRIGLASKLNASRYECATECRPTDADLIGQLLKRGTGLVALDKIAEIREFQFSGHVYDLQTITGWIVANGIFNSNCRCVVLPSFEDAEPVPEPGMTLEELPPVREPLRGLGAKVAAELRGVQFA